MKRAFIAPLLCSAVAIAAFPASAQVAAPPAPSAATAPDASAQAQALPPEADPNQLQDIVVTAQRRSENLQNVPIAVSAVTSDQLTSTGVSDLVDLKLAVPSINLTNSNGYLTSSLRGIGTNGVGPGVENPVATYIDGVYYGSPAASLLALNNIAQIEVLKGPQGTLFGRNATGGLVQITTKTPGQEPSANFDVSYANYRTVTANAYVSGGTGGIVAADLAVHYATQGRGFGVNRANGGATYKLDHDFSARSKIVLTPSDTTTFTLIGDYYDTRSTNNAFRTLPGTVNGFLPSRGREPDYGYDAKSDYLSFQAAEGGGGSLRWDQELGSVKFVSTTAYRKNVSDINFDYDGTERPINTFLVQQTDRQFSQELQLLSNSKSRLTWVLGAFYYAAKAGYTPFNATFNDLGAVVNIADDQKIKSFAGYAQGTYEIVPDTNVTLGVRYTTEKREALPARIDTFVIPLGLQLPTTVVPGQETTFNKFTYRASIDHRFSPEVLIYASANRGFKSGGYNLGSPGSPAYRPETLDAYEVGLKTDLLDRHLRFNIAGFYYNYKDIQVQLLNQGGIAVQNGASARLYGVDADFQAILTDSFRLSGGVGVTHPKFRSYPGCQVSTPLGGTPVTTGSCAGNQLPLAAKFLANLNADYKIDFGGGKLNFNGNAYYNSGFYLESDNVVRQDKYVQLGANIRWTDADDRFSISAFGKNLTDRRVINFATTIPNGTHTGFYQAPRTYGVTLGYNF